MIDNFLGINTWGGRWVFVGEVGGGGVMGEVGGVQGRIQNFSRGGLSNVVYAHCKVKSVRGGALKQNFMDN